MKQGLLLSFFLVLSNIVNGQNCNLIIKGRVLSSDSHEPIEYATIIQEKTLIGTTTDSNGYFKIDNLCPGHLHLLVSHVNFEKQKFQFDIESDTTISIELSANIKLLSTITVVGKKEISDVGYSKATLTRSTLDQMSGKTLGETLEAVSGVTSLKTGPGISKPMIHGLYGNRIRVINNGIRQEGQQWGNEHAPEIDPFAADKITVIKGASVVKYGSDAISGAILVEPADLPDDHHIHGEVDLVGMTNGRLGVLAGKLEGGIGEDQLFRWRAQGTLKAAGDFNTPDYYLTNTGVRESNFSVMGGTTTNRIKSQVYYSFFKTIIGILRGSHIGNLTDLEEAIQRDEPFFTNENFSYEINNPKQEVDHHVLKASFDYKFNSKHSLVGIYGFQHNRRREFDIRRGGRSEKPALDMTLPTHSIDFILRSELSEVFNSETGFRYTYQINRNDSETGVRPLIPNYNTYRPGLYWIGKMDLNRVDLEFGFSYDYQYLETKRFDRSQNLITEAKNFNTFSGSAGLSVPLNRIVRYNVNLSYAMRAPNVNELYSEGLHHGVAAIENGDSNLELEKSLKNIHTFTISSNDRYSFEVSGYFHHVKDFIYLKPDSTFELTIRGAFPVFNYVQRDVNIWGFDVGGRLMLIKNLYWETKASTVHGYNLSEDKYLIYMPADRWRNTLNYRINPNDKIENIEFSISGLQVWQQNRTPMNEVDPERNFESEIQYNFAVYEDFLPPPPGYFLVDVEAGMTLRMGTNRLKIHVAGRNIFNVRYRDYLNRMRYYADDVGRNIELRLKYTF